MATRSRISQKFIGVLAFCAVTFAARQAFAQEEVIERITEHPVSGGLAIALISVGLPALFGYLGKRAESKGAVITTRANAESVFAQRTINGLEAERQRLLKLESKLEAEKDSLNKQVAAFQIQAEVCTERLKQKDARIASLSRRLADLGHPVTGEVGN